VLVGFDFPYDYPVPGSPCTWHHRHAPLLGNLAHVSRVCRDQHDNSNNRFIAAAELNRRISGSCYPFWACPQNYESATMSVTKGGRVRTASRKNASPTSATCSPSGNCLATLSRQLGAPRDFACPGPAHGSCAGRSLPCLAIGDGLQTLPDRSVRDWLVLHAEIYPSVFAFYRRRRCM
jgi:hypothetical protein